MCFPHAINDACYFVADTASISSADSVISVVALLLGFIEFIKEHGLPATQAACAAYPHDDVILEEAEAMRGFLPNKLVDGMIGTHLPFISIKHPAVGIIPFYHQASFVVANYLPAA